MKLFIVFLVFINVITFLSMGAISKGQKRTGGGFRKKH